MRLYSGRIRHIAEEVVRALRETGAIDVPLELIPEAELDVEAVLREYLRTERHLTSRAREMADSGRGSFKRLKRQLAYSANFKLGDEGIDYIVNQLIETFLHSHNVEEIYADDLELRRQISVIVKKHTETAEGELDTEVRAQIKNLSEGSIAWDDEYDRVMKKLKHERSLD